VGNIGIGDILAAYVSVGVAVGRITIAAHRLKNKVSKTKCKDEKR
jgi:hypothetical protein